MKLTRDKLPLIISSLFLITFILHIVMQCFVLNKTDLYFRVLDSYIPIDKALNENYKYISIDVNSLDASNKEKKRLIDCFRRKYPDMNIMDKSFESLKQMGLVKEGNYLEGILLSFIKKKDLLYHTVIFIDGTKFRSGLGADGIRSIAIMLFGQPVIISNQRTWIA